MAEERCINRRLFKMIYLCWFIALMGAIAFTVIVADIIEKWENF